MDLINDNILLFAIFKLQFGFGNTVKKNIAEYDELVSCTLARLEHSYERIELR